MRKIEQGATRLWFQLKNTMSQGRSSFISFVINQCDL
jgi:hypothetical protein